MSKAKSKPKALRGEYRGIYVALVDDPDFQDLSAEARAIFFVLKLKLGLSGIGIFMPETLPRYTGFPSERVAEGLADLCERNWLRVERNVLWLRNGLKHDPNEPLKVPNSRLSIEYHLKTLPKLAIVNEFARYYGLEEPHEIPPSDGGGGKGSGRVAEPKPTKCTVHRIPETTTDAKASGAGAPPNEQTNEPPAGEPSAPGGDITPTPSDERAALHARLAPLIREHAWLGSKPPPRRAPSGKPWGMGNELSIAKQLIAEYSADEVCGAIETARSALQIPPGEPFTLALFWEAGSRHRLELAMSEWRARQLAGDGGDGEGDGEDFVGQFLKWSA